MAPREADKARLTQTTLGVTQMNITTIDQAFQFLQAKGESQALNDAMSAYALGKDKLEKLFDEHLWLDASEDEYAPFDSDVAQQYYIELAGIEEFLVDKGLIYETWGA